MTVIVVGTGVVAAVQFARMCMYINVCVYMYNDLHRGSKSRRNVSKDDATFKFQFVYKNLVNRNYLVSSVCKLNLKPPNQVKRSLLLLLCLFVANKYKKTLVHDFINGCFFITRTRHNISIVSGYVAAKYR